MTLFPLAHLLSPWRAHALDARAFDLKLAQGKLAGGPEVIRVSQDDRVEIRWTTDTEADVHLHGYDIETPIGPGAPATMRFDAYATGRYPITLHMKTGQDHSHRPLLYLEVYPR